MSESHIPERFQSDHLIRRGLKLNHLQLIASLHQTGQISGSAAALAISQPAASRLLKELEKIANAKLHTRHARGIALTELGTDLAARAQAILQDLDAAGREITERQRGQRGRVVVGAVTGAALEYVLPTLRQLRVTQPGIEITVLVDTSDRLADALLAEQVDFYIGRVPQDLDHSEFVADHVREEPISLIVREDHPLTRVEAPTLRQCVAYDWVQQAPGGLLRHVVETRLLELGLPLPERVTSTSSMLMTLAIISQSNAIAPVASAVANFFGGEKGLDGRVASLNIDRKLFVNPYSLLRRSSRRQTPATMLVYQAVKDRIEAAPG
ncbi:LysR family transcriptional regulator [Qingshengfaniella alkalisoli]|uniref:LysR family transcriptional regulator n=1 Tax=Qingshengfaniella alkalisoli TaxID=2599296 RepID=A0A5B8J4M1_9RHOB|nr:LysR family transcriptional regulator [Qingshengfaniella alkalisoli]QDY71648.1 LysR family transcriptional regulator [Qingshengfaniella alkalisoli]